VVAATGGFQRPAKAGDAFDLHPIVPTIQIGDVFEGAFQKVLGRQATNPLVVIIHARAADAGRPVFLRRGIRNPTLGKIDQRQPGILPQSLDVLDVGDQRENAVTPPPHRRHPDPHIRVVQHPVGFAGVAHDAGVQPDVVEPQQQKDTAAGTVQRPAPRPGDTRNADAGGSFFHGVQAKPPDAKRQQKIRKWTTTGIRRSGIFLHTQPIPGAKHAPSGSWKYFFGRMFEWMQPAPAHHMGPMRMKLREPAWTDPLCRVASHALLGFLSYSIFTVFLTTPLPGTIEVD